MTRLVDDIPKSARAEFLADFLEHYVDKQGLGGIPKGDLDALIVHLYQKHTGKGFDAFSLGQRLKIKEGRVKSLYETGLIKYAGLTEGTAWIEILTKLRNTKFELESNERAQIRFKFENPALYKYLQKRLREIGGTATYSSTYEVVTMSLDTFFELLDNVYEKGQSEFRATETDEVHRHVQRVLEQLRESLGKKRLHALKGESGIATTAGKAITTASSLSSIGSLVATILVAV